MIVTSPETIALEIPPRPTDSASEEVRGRVQQLLHRTHGRRRQIERRSERRYPYPYPMYLTPLGADGEAKKEETFAVVGKHLSEHGLDFYHQDPIPYRRMIVSLETCGGEWLGLVLDLTWCRFTRYGWYDNGGRFIGVAESPLKESPQSTKCDLKASRA